MIECVQEITESKISKDQGRFRKGRDVVHILFTQNDSCKKKKMLTKRKKICYIHRP